MTYIRKKGIKNLKYHFDSSGFSKQTISTTLVGYNGTEVSYTPDPNSTSVVYEANYGISWSPDGNGSYPCTRLQYSTDNGNSWVTYSGTRSVEGSFSSEIDYDWFQVFYTFIVPSWLGTRKLRLAGRSYATSAEFTIGEQLYASNTAGVDSIPNIIIYSVGR